MELGYTWKFCAGENNYVFTEKKVNEITMIMQNPLTFGDFSFHNYKDKSLNWLL